MPKTGRLHDEEAWRNAKKVCRLNARQIEMARALGMNPNKLSGLRPSPQQRWKLPVGEFIEERYWKRFGGNTWDNESREPKPGSPKPWTPREDAHAPGAVRDPTWQAQDLICYLTNLSDDLTADHDEVFEYLSPLAQEEASSAKSPIVYSSGSRRSISGGRDARQQRPHHACRTLNASPQHRVRRRQLESPMRDSAVGAADINPQQAVRVHPFQLHDVATQRQGLRRVELRGERMVSARLHRCAEHEGTHRDRSHSLEPAPFVKVNFFRLRR